MASAIYHDSSDPRSKRNPAIDALPPLVAGAEKLRRIRSIEPFTEEDRQRSVEEKLLLLNYMDDFYIPMNWHLDFSNTVEMLIYSAYQHMNPLEHNSVVNAFDIASYGLENFPKQTTSSAITVIGTAGMGKTTGINKVLQHYPQLIEHEKYKDQVLEHKQIVWLYVQVPFDASIRGFCLDLLSELDRILGTEYSQFFFKRGVTIDVLQNIIARLCHAYTIGLIVIDEIQNLIVKGQSKNQLNEFLNTLSNKASTSFCFLGTPKALELFQGTLHLCRRIEKSGSFTLNPYEPNARDWKRLVSALWENYNCLSTVQELTPEIRQAFYDVSQGIPDNLIRVFKESQKILITSERLSEDGFTPEFIRDVAQEKFKYSQEKLEDIKNGNLTSMNNMTDYLLDKIATQNIITQNDSTCKTSKSDGNHIESTILEYYLDIGYQVYFSEEELKSLAHEISVEANKESTRADYISLAQKRIDERIKAAGLDQEAQQDLAEQEEVLCDETTIC